MMNKILMFCTIVFTSVVFVQTKDNHKMKQ